MNPQYFVFFIMIISINANQSNKPIVLNIGGLFNDGNSSIDHGQDDLQAAQMAVDEINLRSDDLFNGYYYLTLLANNSKV